MSSPAKDPTSPIPSEHDAHPPSDLNIDDEAPVTTTAAPAAALAVASTETAAKKPESPQVPLEASFHEEQDNGSPAVASAASTTPTAVTPPAAQVQSPTAPASEREAKLAILTEAFPTVEKEVCEFVLESHRGNVEASINALLEISDPEFQPEPQQAAPPAAAAPPADAPPALPRRQDPDELSQGVANMNFEQNQPRAEIDPLFLASTSTSEQQLRADEDFARTLAAMDEYRARDRQNVRNQQTQQQQHQEEEEQGPSFATEIKELMDEELPKIKERFNVAADTTKKKVSEWYSNFKASRAEAAQRNANQGQSSDSYRTAESRNREPIRFDSRMEEDEPLSRNRASPPLRSGATPPLPARPYNVDSAETTTTSTEPLATSPNSRRTTLEDGNV